MNRAWDEWADRNSPPMRACLAVTLEGETLVEIVVDAVPERVDTAPETGRVTSAPVEIAENYLVETEPGRLAAADLARAIVGQGFDLSELVEVKPDLERVFLDLTRRASAIERNAA